MKKIFWVICISHMFIEVYLLMQVALIPVYIREFRLSLLEVSLVAIIPSLIQLLMNIPSGFMTDRFNSKYLLFASMMMEGLSALVMSQTRSFWTLVTAVSVNRISSPLYHIAGLSQISRVSDRDKMSRSIGVHNALGSLGAALGLASVTISLSTVGWRWAYLFWTVPVLAWGFVVLGSPRVESTRFEKEEATKKENLPKFLKVFSIRFVAFLAATGLYLIGTTATSTFMTMYLVKLVGLSEATASLIFGLGPFVGILGSLSGGYVGQKTNAKRALGLFIAGCTISLSIMAFSSQLYVLTVIYAIYMFFSYSVWAPMNTLVAEITPSKERGLSYSVYFFSEGLIASVAPAAAVAVITAVGIWYVMPFSIIFLLGGLMVLQLLYYPAQS